MIQHDVPLKPYCHYRIGGCARHFLEVHSRDELTEGVREWRALADGGRAFVLGAGCNVLIDDGGYDGLVVHNAMASITREADGRLRVGTGLLVSELLAYCVEHGLAGLEWAGGLPGSVGGAVFCSAGAFGGQIEESIIAVESIALDTLETRLRGPAECQFGYRDSLFKRRRLHECITAVVLSVTPGDPEELSQCIASKVAYRRERQPLEFPNIGSIFKNVPVWRAPAAVVEQFRHKVKTDPIPLIPTAALLAEAGLRGVQRGDIKISCKHPNFFVNLREGRACDVRYLIRLAQETVQERFGVALEPEIVEPV